MQATQTQDEKRRLLRQLPPGTHRVQVLTSRGKTKFKRPEEVEATDKIVINGTGNVVVMRGKPGRKPKATVDPVSDEVRDIMAARETHFTESDLLGAATEDPSGDPVLDYVLRGMAEEVTSLEFEKILAERHGSDTSGLSSKRLRGLKALGETWLKRREKLQAGVIDIESETFKALFSFALETFRESMKDAGIRPEHVETVFTRLSKRLDGPSWKQEAQARMREA